MENKQIDEYGETYYFEYANLCKQYNEKMIDDDWKNHYQQLLRKREDDVIGW